MKVILFSVDWPEYMIELANGLSKNCRVTLVLPYNYGLQEVHKKAIHKNVKLRLYKFIDYVSIRQNIKMLFEILRIIWTEQPDILHIQSNGFGLFYIVAMLKPFKTKIVNTIHDPEKHSGDLLSLATDDTAIIKWMKRFTTHYIVHGPSLVKVLAKAYAVSEQKITSIPHGHLGIYKTFQDHHSKEQNNNILFFGRIWPYKGLQYFIEAANLVHETKPNVIFTIAGKGENLDRYISMMKNINGFRIINKKIPLNEVGLLFEQSTVVVLPYIDATQSGVIPLAYAYGKPVIATRVGALPDVVRDQVTGFLVDAQSAAQIAEKIIRLIEDTQLRKTMGAAAFSYANEELSWDNIGAMTYSLYLKL